MKPFINGSPATWLAIFMASLFVSVSASQNILNGWSLGVATSEIHAAIFAAGSLAGAICQPVSWYAAWAGFDQKQIGRAIAAAMLGLTCLAYATLSSLAFVSTARSDGVASREKSADLYRLSSDRAAAALAELKTINSAPRGNARTETRKAERRAQLDLLIADAEKALRKDSAPAAIDPAASSLAAYASALGWQLSEAQISPWLTAAIVLFFEIGAGLSLIVVSLVVSVSATKSTPNVETQSDTQPDEANDSEPEPTPPGRPRGRPRSATPDSVIARIRSNGGAVTGNLGAIGRVIGLPAKTTAHRMLRELKSAGSLAINATSQGTTVTLVANGK